jgi:hypothetical protein
MSYWIWSIDYLKPGTRDKLCYSQWLTWLAKAAVAVLLVHTDSMDAWRRDTLVQIVLTQGSAKTGTTVTAELCSIACTCAPILTWRRGAWVCFFLARLAGVTWKHNVKTCQLQASQRWIDNRWFVVSPQNSTTAVENTPLPKRMLPRSVRIWTGRLSNCFT